MTTLTADVVRNQRNVQGKSIARYAIATNETIYVGSLCTILTTSGRMHALGTPTASHRFVGVCEKGGTGNTSGTVYADVAYMCEVLVDCATGITSADIGRDALLSDDNKVTNTAAGTAALRIPVGEVTDIESGDAWVFLRKYSGQTAAT